MSDKANITCNLCKKGNVCRVKNVILTDLDGYASMKLIHNDFDDIMADLAAICHNFEGE